MMSQGKLMRLAARGPMAVCKSMAVLLGLALSSDASAESDPKNWPSVLEEAQGQTVYWHAWGGDAQINAYFSWVGSEVEKRFGVRVEQVKLSDTAEAVSRVLAEKAAGVTEGGAVDLIWINGENFAAMKENDLLFGPFAEDLPNWQWVDVEGKPTVRNDFTVPTEGFEAPFGMAQVVFYYDEARLKAPPTNADSLLAWIKTHPGRFTYPDPSNFLGITFLKQLIYAFADEPVALLAPPDDALYERYAGPLWDWLDEARPYLWRQGRTYPQNGPDLRQRVADGEVDIGLSFNPAEASLAIANYTLPDTVRTFVFDDGTIGNTSFVAIPFNATATAGAMVVADFLMSPYAQAHKQDPKIWGAFTVLDVERLDPQDKKRFDDLELGIATLSPTEIGPPLPEPHPAWVERLQSEWVARYADGS